MTYMEKNTINKKGFIHSVIAFINKFKFMFLVMLVTASYSGAMSMRTMPFAEGWYTYYAQCINNGEVVYRDFDYLFTPAYIRFIAFFTKIFGYKIISLRILGVIFFTLISVILYLIIREMFNEGISAIAAITGALYIQSEVVQIFYDYIRFMDVFSCLTVLFLVKAVKANADTKKCNRYLFIAGIANAMFLLIKQNMGLLFVVYAVLLILAINLVLHKKFKNLLINEAYFIVGFLIPVLITVVWMLIDGSLVHFFSQTGSSAIAAKGGVQSILFGWIQYNLKNFTLGKKLTLVSWFILILGLVVRKKFPKFVCDSNKNIFDIVLGLLFGIGVFAGFIVFIFAESTSAKYVPYGRLITYNLFTIVFAVFVVLVVHAIVLAIRKKEISLMELMIITTAGSYFAISYGCGMSSGLAEGQAGVGLALLIALLLYSLDIKVVKFAKIGVVFICALVSLQCIAFKMNRTYAWWGMIDSSYWASEYESPDIELLEGIKISQENLDGYEEIYHVITENTSKDDPIVCFPQIPIFYSICDRTDPGFKAKVQWFDVASDESIDHDMQVIRDNPPSAILIFRNTGNVYDDHERLFRNGGVSATRRMRDFLYEYATENGYAYDGPIVLSPENSFDLYYIPG